MHGDVALPGGEFFLGAFDHLTFVFDNEKWAHPVRVAPFCMARAATTQEEFVAFVEDEGYTRRGLWTDAGWAWRQREAARCPVYWRKEAGRSWLRRVSPIASRHVSSNAPDSRLCTCPERVFPTQRWGVRTWDG